MTSIIFHKLPISLILSVFVLNLYAQTDKGIEKILKADTSKFNYGGTGILDINLQSNTLDTNSAAGKNKLLLISEKLKNKSSNKKDKNAPNKPEPSNNTTEKYTSGNEPSTQPKTTIYTTGTTSPLKSDLPVANTRTVQPVYVPATVENYIPRNKLIEKPIIEPRKGEDLYKIRLAAIPSLIPLDYNETVKAFINMYLNEKRDQVSRMLSRTDNYFSTFEETLNRYGLPIELKYLPVIESALIAHAQSETGEAGLWQLPYKVAKQHGLDTNDFIDERRDPQLSTEAAAKELSRLYRHYGNWHWVIAAYNCGEGAVNKAIQLSGNRRNYWDAANFLPIEAQAYVPLYIAAVYVMEYYPQHSIQKYDATYMYYATDTVRVKRGINLKKVATNIDIPLNELVYLNPAVIRDTIPPSWRGYPINLPASKLGAFTAYINNLDPNRAIFIDGTKDNSINLPEKSIWNENFDEFGNTDNAKSTANNKPLRNVMQEYKVREGDALSTIAKKFDCSIADIKRWNKLKSDKVTLGETLAIYISEENAGLNNSNTNIDKTEPSNYAPPAPKANNAKPKEYKVKEGDTIWSIAQKFDVEPEILKKYNGLKGNKPLSLNAIIKIPPKK
jgi:membrane-bound lytic murein transglycosylase D